MADPLSDLELVKTRHSSRCHTGPTNAKPDTAAGLQFSSFFCEPRPLGLRPDVRLNWKEALGRDA